MKLHEIAEQHPCPLLFATITGSRLFGCASSDSDFDVHGAHVRPVQEIVGFTPLPETIERKESTIDLSTHELKKFVLLMMNGNGGVLESLFSPLIVYSTPVHQEMKNLGKGCMTKQVALYYKSMAFSQQKRVQANEVKKLIHMYRNLLTGIYLMKTGQLEMSLPTLAGVLEQEQVYRLIAQKKEGLTVVPDGLLEHMARIETLKETLDRARDDSRLPESTTTRAELEQLVVRVRLENI